MTSIRTTTTKNSRADRLLEAHVAFLLSQLEGAALTRWIERELDALLAAGQRLTLESVVSRAMIKTTASTYAVKMELGPGIPELVGEIASRVYAHPAHASTTLAQLVPDATFNDFLEKTLELKTLREALLREAVANPLYAELASDLLYRGLRDYLSRSGLTQKIPGAGAAMRLGKSVISKASPKLEGSLESSLRKYIDKSIKSSLRESESFLLENFDAERLREVALTVWDEIKGEPLSRFREYIEGRDVEEFFVAGYEAWRHVRQTPLYAALIDAGIDAFFDRYGKTPLTELLEEIGLSREMLLREALHYAKPVLAVLRKKKLLEEALRRNLADFYESTAAQEIIGVD